MQSVFYQKKNILFVLAGVVILGGFAFFEKNFFLNFFSPSPASVPAVSSQNPPTSPDHTISKPIPPPQPANTSSFLTNLSYTGRDPGEFRPVADEVKLFSAAQIDRIKAALDEDARAVKMNPEFFDGWIQIGLYKKMIGDYVGARDAWEYAGVLQPKNSLSFANLGELYWHYISDFPKAENNLKISIKHKPDDIQTFITLAELYHYSYTAKRNLAPQVLLDGLKANPDNGTLMRRLAYLYEQREEWGNALSWWQKILNINPGDDAVVEKVNKLKAKTSSAGK